MRIGIESWKRVMTSATLVGLLACGDAEATEPEAPVPAESEPASIVIHEGEEAESEAVRVEPESEPPNEGGESPAPAQDPTEDPAEEPAEAAVEAPGEEADEAPLGALVEDAIDRARSAATSSDECDAAYEEANAALELIRERAPDRVPGSMPSREDFVTVCAGLPEAVQSCLRVSYVTAHQAECTAASRALSPRQRAEVERMLRPQ